MSSVSGIAAIAKVAGVTSFSSLNPLKKSLGSSKIGHTGTLDRFATGLLIALVGSYSRLSGQFTALDKTYRAVVRLGQETSTLDPEGTVVAEGPLPSREAIEAVLPQFRGPILQAPPVYSALHIDGKRAYERALKGEAVEMKPRPVTIHSLELLEFSGDSMELLVSCSSGTYIRSLARDIALAAGSRASLSALCRESIGPFTLAQAVAPGDFSPELLLPLSPTLALALGLRPRVLPAPLVALFRQGGRIAPSALADPHGVTAPEPGQANQGSAVFSPDGAFLGLVDEGQGAAISYRFVCGVAP